MKRLLRGIKNRLIAPVVLSALHRLGIHYKLNSPDREFLEQEIIGKLIAGDRYQEVLFAGVEVYTWHYKYLMARKVLHTIDRDESKQWYGNGRNHRIGSVCDLEKLYGTKQFDIVVFNGLVGYGLDSAMDVDRALCNAYAVLRDGGMLIIGWNNTPAHLTFSLDQLPGYRLFCPNAPLGLGLHSYRHEIPQASRHTFDFLTKAPRAE